MYTQKLLSLETWLLTIGQPFFYGAITRMPFVYFIIHLRTVFKLDWVPIAFIVGGYQGCRAVSNIVTNFAPRTAHVGGTLLGLVGNVMVLAFGADEHFPVIIGTILIGLSESVAAMQNYAKKAYGNNLKTLQQHLKMQYAMVLVGVTTAFLSGGFVYEWWGITGVAIYGIFLSTAELICVFGYFMCCCLHVKPQDQDSTTTESSIQDENVDSECVHDDDVEDMEMGPDGTGEDFFTTGAHTPKQTCEEVADTVDNHGNKIQELLDAFSESGFGATWVNFVLSVTFGVQATAVGYSLIITPIYVTQVFELSPSVIGLLMAAGTGFGTTMALILAWSPQAYEQLEKYMPSPYGLLFSLGCIALSGFIAPIPVFSVFIVGVVILMAFNDLAAFLLTEMQGAITSHKAYSRIAPLGQVIRRTGNVCTAVSGVLLYGLLPELPYLVAGVVTTIWTLLLISVFHRRTQTNRQILRLDSTGAPEWLVQFFSNSSFPQQEILARQVKRGGEGTLNIEDSQTSSSLPEGDRPNPSKEGRPQYQEEASSS